MSAACSAASSAAEVPVNLLHDAGTIADLILLSHARRSRSWATDSARFTRGPATTAAPVWATDHASPRNACGWKPMARRRNQLRDRRRVGVFACPPRLASCLTGVQHDLFDLGGELCIPGHHMIQANTRQAGATIGWFNEGLPPLKEFIYPAATRPRRLPRRARGLPARGTALLVAGARRNVEARGAQVSQPTVRFIVRAGAGFGPPGRAVEVYGGGPRNSSLGRMSMMIEPGPKRGRERNLPPAGSTCPRPRRHLVISRVGGRPEMDGLPADGLRRESHRRLRRRG